MQLLMDFHQVPKWSTGKDLRTSVALLPGPDYFDEEAKCYSRLFEFCQVTFCHSRRWVV
jgi:hypothetical protein